MLIEPCKFWTNKVGVSSTPCIPEIPAEPPGPDCGEYDWDNATYAQVPSSVIDVMDNGFVSEDGSTALVPATVFSSDTFLIFRLSGDEYVYTGSITPTQLHTIDTLSGLSTDGSIFAMYEPPYERYIIAEFTSDVHWEQLHSLPRPNTGGIPITASVFSDDFTRYYQLAENFGPPTGLYMREYIFDIDTGNFTLVNIGHGEFTSGGYIHASTHLKISANGQFLLCGYTDGFVVMKNMDGQGDWQIYGEYFSSYGLMPADISNNGDYILIGPAGSHIDMAYFDESSDVYRRLYASPSVPYTQSDLPCSTGFSNNGEYAVVFNRVNSSDNGGIARVKLECGR